MAVPCTPPRHRRWAPGGLTVPAFLRNSHSDSQLNLRLTEDPATHIFALLRKHKLPESIYYTSTETESPKSLPLLPPSFLRHSETLLPSIGRCLAEAADVFAPQRRSPLVPGPSKDNTDKFGEYFEGVGERARLSTNAHRFFCRAMADSEFIVKFLHRPLNELMQCMLLPLGVQVFWRLTDRNTSLTSRMELVWRQIEGDIQSLAVLEVTTPQAVPDNEMLTLLDYLRRGLVKIDKNGKFDVKTQVFFGGRGKPWSAAGSLAARAIDAMRDTDSKFSIMSNCNRFIVIQEGRTEAHGRILEFSDVINVSDMPHIHLAQSPLGLLLAVAVKALAQRGVTLHTQAFSPPATLVFENITSEHFGPNLSSKRRSYSAKARRRAVFGNGLNPSHVCHTVVTTDDQLGAATFRITIAEPFSTLLQTHHLLHAGSLLWPAPFHGPWTDTNIPDLLPEATSQDATWVPELELTEYKGRGLWTVFCARFSWLKGPSDLLVKIAAVRNVTSTAISTDLAVYDHLKPLQGRVIPRFLGLLGSYQPDHTQQWAALFDDAGYPLQPNDGDSHVQSTIKKHYEDLHAAGVLHIDVGWHHILRHNDAIRLVGFKGSVIRTIETDEAWAEKCNEEMGKVNGMLGQAVRSLAAEAYRLMRQPKVAKVVREPEDWSTRAFYAQRAPVYRLSMHDLQRRRGPVPPRRP